MLKKECLLHSIEQDGLNTEITVGKALYAYGYLHDDDYQFGKLEPSFGFTGIAINARTPNTPSSYCVTFAPGPSGIVVAEVYANEWDSKVEELYFPSEKVSITKTNVKDLAPLFVSLLGKTVPLKIRFSQEGLSELKNRLMGGGVKTLIAQAIAALLGGSHDACEGNVALHIGPCSLHGRAFSLRGYEWNGDRPESVITRNWILRPDPLDRHRRSSKRRMEAKKHSVRHLWRKCKSSHRAFGHEDIRSVRSSGFRELRSADHLHGVACNAPSFKGGVA